MTPGPASCRLSSPALAVAAVLAFAACVPPPCDRCADLAADLASAPDLAPAADLTSRADDLTSGAADLTQGGADLTTASADPSQPGPRRTATLTLAVPLAANATLKVTLIGPSDDGATLSLSGAPYPLVIISPGFQLPTAQFLVYGQRLASHGFVAAHQEYRNAGDHAQDAQDTVALIDWLLRPSGADAAKVQGRVDGARVGLTGHSLGGKVSLLAAQRDARVKALLTIDPVDGQPPLAGMQPAALPGMGALHLANGAPLGFLGETTSKGGVVPCTPAAQNYEVLYAAASAPTFAITFSDAGHMDFVNDFAGCGLVCTVCKAGAAPKARTRDLAVKYVAAYFLWTLAGDVAAQDYLLGALFASDAASGAVSLVKK